MRVLTLVCVQLTALFFAVTVSAGPLEACKEYTKYGVPGQSGEIICRKGHLLSHDSVKKTPIWVTEHLTAERADGTISRESSFHADPDLEKGERAETSDYDHSGFDQGHMAPAADMRWDAQAMKDCFYLSNIVPQVGIGNNRGIWKSLEEKIRKWAAVRGDLYVYTGPLYLGTSFKSIGTGKVLVPTHFYKVVFDCSSMDTLAFIIPNKKVDTKDLPKYLVSVREVEQKSGLNFLSRLKQTVQDNIETQAATEVWQ